MRTHSRYFSSLLAATLLVQATAAQAITVARITRRGYIIVDEAGDYGDQIPVSNTRDTATFIGDVTGVLSKLEGFREGRFLAAMQIPSTQSPLAFYLPIRNEVRGLGQRSTLDGRTEVFDNNSFFNTSFRLDGFVYLNSYRFYTDPRAVIYGRFLICTQEFGHRFGVNLLVPPLMPNEVDAGVPDAGADAGADAGGDAGATVDASADVAADGARDASADAIDAGPLGLARDALLGRGNQNAAGMVTNRSHWSYFFNSGGSPMEGNNWSEIAPGMFRTDRPSFRFSPIDLYVMGLIPAAQVPTTFLITNPENVPRGITRDSPPEFYARQVTVRGRKVEVSINDLIRANGARTPGFSTANRDLDVVWVLLAPAAAVNDELAAEFDEAIDSCAMGYAFATADRGRLVSSIEETDAGTPDASTSDGGAEVPTDAGARPDVNLGDVPTIPPPDGMVAPEPPSVPLRASGGCQCDVPSSASPTRGVWALALAFVALSTSRRRRTESRPS